MLGPDETAHLVDGIKSVGFQFATRGGLTIGLWDIVTPPDKGGLLAGADTAVTAYLADEGVSSPAARDAGSSSTRRTRRYFIGGFFSSRRSLALPGALKKRYGGGAGN